jgi:hypothetical protein
MRSARSGSVVAAVQMLALSPAARDGSWNGSPGNPLVLGATAAL